MICFSLVVKASNCFKRHHNLKTLFHQNFGAVWQYILCINHVECRCSSVIYHVDKSKACFSEGLTVKMPSSSVIMIFFLPLPSVITGLFPHIRCYLFASNQGQALHCSNKIVINIIIKMVKGLYSQGYLNLLVSFFTSLWNVVINRSLTSYQSTFQKLHYYVVWFIPAECFLFYFILYIYIYVPINLRLPIFVCCLANLCQNILHLLSRVLTRTTHPRTGMGETFEFPKLITSWKLGKLHHHLRNSLQNRKLWFSHLSVFSWSES